MKHHLGPYPTLAKLSSVLSWNKKLFVQLRRLRVLYAIIFLKVSKIKLAGGVRVREEALWADASLRFHGRRSSVTDPK
jgi:hypothetical protein